MDHHYMSKCIVDSPAALDKVTDPMLVSEKLSLKALEASKDFIQSYLLNQLQPQQLDNVISLEILNGGKFYYVADAFKAVTHRDCFKVVTLRAKRSFDEANQAWKVNIWDAEQLAGFSGASALIIGDTIATAVTLAGVLEYVLKQMEKEGSFVSLFIFTIAGSAAFIDERLGGVSKKLFDLSGGKCKIHVVFANAQFHLNANGTDLQFEGKDFTATESAEKFFHERLAGSKALMKCAVWDWGDRFTKPASHLREVKDHFKHVESSDVQTEYLKAKISQIMAYEDS